MKITLEIDDAAIPIVAGEDAGKLVLAELKKYPAWWLWAADSIAVEGRFGKHEEIRNEAMR